MDALSITWGAFFFVFVSAGQEREKDGKKDRVSVSI
jgi:hypothetical protein